MKRTLVVVSRVAIMWGRMPSDDWVSARLDIMSRLAVPAMAQRPDGVVWVWRTAPHHRGQVSKAAPDGVLVVDQYDKEDARVPGDRFLVMRLDSDDTWLPKTLRQAHELARDTPPNTLHDWPVGYQLDLVTGAAQLITYIGRWQSPFLAVTQESRDAMFDTGGPHTEAGKGRNVIRHGGPSWVQGIHEGNVSNAWRPDAAAVETSQVYRDLNIIAA